MEPLLAVLLIAGYNQCDLIHVDIVRASFHCKQAGELWRATSTPSAPDCPSAVVVHP